MPIPSSIEDATPLLRSLREALKAPIASLDLLLSLLRQPLDLLGLDDNSAGAWSSSRDGEAREILLSRFIGSLQSVLLTSVIPIWWESLDEGDEARALLQAWFCPREPAKGWDARRRHDADRVAVSSYQILTTCLSTPSPAAGPSRSPSLPSSPVSISFAIPVLVSLSHSYPLARLHASLFDGYQSRVASPKQAVVWERLLRVLVKLPAKISNATEGGRRLGIPVELEQPVWLGGMTTELETVVWRLSEQGMTDSEPLSLLLHLLLRTGYISPWMSPQLPQPDSHPSTFFSALLPLLLPRLSAKPSAYSRLWQSIFMSLPFADLARVAESLLRHLLTSCDPKETTRAARVMELLVGRGDDTLFEQILLGSDPAPGQTLELKAQVGVLWVGGRGKDMTALHRFMLKTLDIWSDGQFVKFSLASKHIYISTLFILVLRSFPPNSPPLFELSTSPQFLSALTHYLSHHDRTIRHLGMLTAEVVSSLALREGAEPLDFKVWEGDEGGKDICRHLRTLEVDWRAFDKESQSLLGWETSAEPRSPLTQLLPIIKSPRVSSPPSMKRTKKKRTRTSAKITVLSDSDDSLTGYASADSATSSRSASPTPSDLDEYIEDPTLYAPKKKKVPRPVYLAQLGELLSSRDDPEKLETGLKWGEALVRRKQGFGLELEENTVYITTILAGLNDNFELEDFDARKQGILNALVACAPCKAAPTLIEQYFVNQYSEQQRSAMLTALAMGARECASLPTITAPSLPSVNWPSKQLPPALHQRFISPIDSSDARRAPPRIYGPVEQAASDLSSLAIERSRSSAESKVPEIQREKRLRVRTPASASSTSRPFIVESSAPMSSTPTPRRPIASLHEGKAFKDIAAEYFILPLINRFWLHYNDAASLAFRRAPNASAAAGSGMILSPLSLGHLLATLSVLIHAARHAPPFLAVLAPETLQLAVTLGARPMPATRMRGGGDDENDEATVLAGTLELALVVLDTCGELDGGRTMMLDHGGLTMACVEWAEMVFQRSESGVRVRGETEIGPGAILAGGASRVRRASAGLCVVLGGIRERWARLVGFD